MKRVRNLIQVLCVLLVALSVTNCQNDTVAEVQQEEAMQQEFPFKSSQLTRQDIETNSKLSTQIRSLATLQTSSFSESAYNETYNFTVYTDVANFVESTENNSHSYTFPISRDNNTSSALENIVFSYNVTTGDYDASLVTYHFTASQKQEFLSTKHVNTPHQITSESIAMNLSDLQGENSLPCTTTYSVYHITPDTGNTFLYSTNGFIQNSCEHEDGDDPCETFTLIDIYCPNSDGGSPSPNDSTQNPYNSPNNTAGGGNNTSGGTTTPNTNDDDTTDNIVTSAISREDAQRITNELNSMGIDGDTWEFTDEPMTGTLTFDSVDEFEVYINSINNIEGDVSNLQTNNPGTKTGVFSTPLSSHADLNVKVYQQMGDFFQQIDYSIIDVESNTSGLDFIFFWEPDDNHGETIDPYGEAKVVQYGTLKIGAVIEGRGIFYRRNYTIFMYLDAITGEAIRSLFVY